ncbi:hypothetical protein M407DRAFT_242539 [Tulasnella calospora MUT 4182]|uniref:Uncharacterized protein n=1 Tax=Tulasnella calospora MUT 4182 TaxID=1051891 RepID=A0A0C3L732_9AGAM|nr:hypothetical protein M407DRAFT_242539 [Tulasnella calospora MUT 4182]
MHFRPKHEPDWEVVDHKGIDLVPTLYEDNEVDVQYVFSTDITRTYIFDAPSSPKPSPPPSPSSQPSPLLAPPSPKASSSPLSSPMRRFSRLSTTSTGSPHFRFRFSRSATSSTSSSCSSSSDSSDDEAPASPCRTSIFKSKSKSPARKSLPAPEAPAGFTLSQTRDALRYARAQLLATDQVTKLGANVLLFEGWAVTHLRKGSQHRLQIRYSGRPARVSFASPPSSPSIPPFMELLPSL